MHRTTGGVTTGLGQRQRFLVHTLAAESRITVNQHGQNLGTQRIATPIHTGARRPLHHGVHNFQVRWVKRQAQVHWAAGGGHIGAKALVVFHVTSRQVFWGGVVKLCEQVFGHFAQGVHQHVQTATVCHADHYFLHAFFTSQLNQFVHRSDEALATFQGETLLAHIFGVQVALQALGCGQSVQNVFFLFGAELGLATHALQFLLPPTLFALVRGVHVLHTQGAAISLAQRIEQLTQTQRFAAKEGVGNIEYGFLVGIVKAIEAGLQLRNIGALSALEGVNIGPAVTHVAVGCNELLNRGALATHFRVCAGGHDHFANALLGTLGKCVDDRHVRHIFGVAAIHCGHVLQSIKILAPGVGHAAGVGEVVFVHLFDVRCIATKQVGVVLIGLVHG